MPYQPRNFWKETFPAANQIRTTQAVRHAHDHVLHVQNVWRNCGGRAREIKLKQESTYFILEKSVAKFNPKVLGY
jgi:hypothetical protein